MNDKPQLRVFQSMDPNSVSIGWIRKDIPSVAHVFAQVHPSHRGMLYPSNGRGGSHWPCLVCDAHGYTQLDFETQIHAISAPEPT